MAGYGSPKADDEAEKATKVKLPSHKERIEWHDEWEEKTRADREESLRDCEYVHGEQWTQDEKDILKKRNQPPTVKNRIARKINYLLGELEEKGVDPVARPRTPQHEDDARAATDAMRYVEEEQEFDTARSAVCWDILVPGFGGIHVGGGGEDDEICAPLTQVKWNRLWWDPTSCKTDFSDARHRGIIVWKDLDEAIEDYPDAEDALREAVNKDRTLHVTTDDRPRKWVDGRRKRVKLIETYFRIGKDYYRSCDTEAAELAKAELTGYLDKKGKHHVCPLVMASCYIDENNARYGVVRQLRSPQDELNKRSSKILHRLSTKSVIAERDAIIDPDKFMAELAKPDGFAEVEPGRLSDGSIQIIDGGTLAAGEMQLLQEAKQDIDSIGPSASNLPELPESSSGKAFVARQKAAAKEMTPVFRVISRFDVSVFEQDWLRIRQFKTEEWWLRVTDDQELTGYRFVALNQRMTRAQRFQELLKKGVPPESALQTATGNDAQRISFEVQQIVQSQMQMQGQQEVPPEQLKQATQAMLMQHPLMQQVITVNQAAQMDVDIIIDESPESSIITDEQFDKVLQLAPAYAAAGKPLPIDLLIKWSSIHNKRELLETLNNQDKQDPQMAQLQQAMQQLQMALQQATVQKTQAEGALSAAQAEKTQVETQLLGPKAEAEIESKKAQSMAHAATAGEKTGGLL
jgi:hypothetical protein